MKPFIVDNYIVRIYRRNEDDPREVTGIVECVETEERQAFHNLDELWNVLKSPMSRLALRREKITKSGKERKT